MFFERVCDAQVEWENALNLCVTHPLKKDKLQNISVVYDFKLILYNIYQKLRQLHAILQPKVVFQKLNSALEILKGPRTVSYSICPNFDNLCQHNAQLTTIVLC